MTYSKDGEEAEEQPLRDKLMSSVDSEVLAYDNYQNFNEAVFGTPEPPRALPSSEQHPVPGMSISFNFWYYVDIAQSLWDSLKLQKVIKDFHNNYWGLS